MTWTVTSHRLPWASGTVVGQDELAGCNIDALVTGGHLSPVQPKTTKKPVVPADEPADEPEEQN
jgi:hypothetical protein